jgi:antitoxin (DNA-binding transcriptional repressor) of toxin-antitoxin stability system
MKAAGIREFKAKLSRYLAEVRRGEVVLITDRGEVVAEVRKPALPVAQDPVRRALWPLVVRGEVRLGDPSLPGSRRRDGVDARLPPGVVSRELNEVRADADRDVVARSGSAESRRR